MELMKLEMFVAVVEEGSVHKAAEKVYRTQPAISIALKKLENEIGSPLFNRSQRYDYQLTPAGELLYSYATRILALRDETIASMRKLVHLRNAVVRIGANESTSVFLLPKLTQEFHERYPEIKVEVTCGHSEELLSDLQAHRLDLAMLGCLPEDHTFEAQLIMRDELVLIVSPNHRLALADHVEMKDLEEESIITEGAPSSLHKKVVEAFRSNQAHVQVMSATIETVKQMVANNVGVGFLPLMCVEREAARGELVLVPVNDLYLERSLWAVRLRSDMHSHGALAFMRIINSFAKKLNTEQSRKCRSRSTSGADVIELQKRKQG